ncbi:hypothetical protein LOTGIDRAFT_158828 [Lottia gigantea]|uniref:Carnosine N-methyltransferase n=1 Tax=Lottia gigantea TaxID=225164 RepID=V4AV84_LOTGI|nr:hypothetical protein LOTGIDRAFT_158828 [Lottia gigantea]ESO98875.1 hypothetical protein LOTGIDRAFT_158828 [Lottia gigantea]
MEMENKNSNEIDKQKADEEERRHFMKVLNGFKCYRNSALQRVKRAERYFDEIPERHRNMIPYFKDHLATIRTCIDHNSQVVEVLIKDANYMFENSCQDIEDENNLKGTVPSMQDVDRVKTTLKQFVRDWSAAGEKERKACYEPVLQEIESLYRSDVCNPSEINILVPGSGLGRLAYEIASRGYVCQGNEWSLYMLIASHFVLNKCCNKNSFTIYPWIHEWTNNKSHDHQTAPVTFPDVCPSEGPPLKNFSMAAGDFLEVYTDKEVFDCVASVFFIDTAHNIIAYIEKIYHILKPGGYWINLGPLLYHFADSAVESSIELSYEEVKQVVIDFGFILKKEQTEMRTTYIQNPNSMIRYEYDSVFFVFQKAEQPS